MPRLSRFTLSDMVATSSELRQLGRGSGSQEEFANEVVSHLRRTLVDSTGDGSPDTALVRFYKTAPYGELPPDLQEFATKVLGDEGQPDPSTRCLTLLATQGDEADWCDRRRSTGHRAVPLPSEEVVARSPMIAQLVSQFGLPASAIVERDPSLLVELDEKTYNVFYVPEARESPHIPAQDFVVKHGIAAALGFGGMLPTGDLYAVVLFSRVVIPQETADLFGTLAMSVKVAFLPLLASPLLGEAAGRDVVGQDTDAPTERRHRKLAVEQLLEVHERIATDQAIKLEAAWAAERALTAQLRGLSEAAALINSSLSLDEILERVTAQARLIVGAHHAVTSMTVGPQAPGPIRGWLAAPLVGRDGRNLGLIQLSDKHTGDFTAEDEAILAQLAQMASITIENAQLYQREHAIAAELQRSLLPQELPSYPGVEVAARYHAGAAGVDIGGDWYDVFPVGDSLAVALGDVAGRGIAAAAVMGQLRMALRAYALDEDSPSVVVARLDRLLQQLGLVEFATLAYGLWAPGQGALDLVLAGHPAPVVIVPGEEIVFADVKPSVPLGAVPGAAFSATTIPFAAGSTLLLYSDGLVESRELSLVAGLDRLRRCIAGAPAGLDDLCDHIATQAVADDADDDVTLLAVRAVAIDAR